MISKKLKERTFLIKATPLPNRTAEAFKNRRGTAGIIMEEEVNLSDKYDTFFDYEDDIADLKPSGEQYAEMIEKDPYVILEEKEDEDQKVEENQITQVALPTILEDIEEGGEEAPKALTKAVGFEFIQCSFTKKDGNRCKRQAPKGSDICSTHKRYIDKHK